MPGRLRTVPGLQEEGAAQEVRDRAGWRHLRRRRMPGRKLLPDLRRPGPDVRRNPRRVRVNLDVRHVWNRRNSHLQRRHLRHLRGHLPGELHLLREPA